MEKTNYGLVDHAKRALTEKWGYVWGTFGQVLTGALLATKAKQYPDGVGLYSVFIEKNWLNKRTVDCVGLIKSYLWTDEDNTIKYNMATDITADMMYSRATKKGVISSMPDVPGICVWKKGHIGIYIGGGQVIEAHGTKYGVILTPLTGQGATPWTHWLECPYIKYVTPQEDPGLWKFDGIEKLNKYGILHDLPYWSARVDEAAPVWFVAALVQNMYEKVKEGK